MRLGNLLLAGFVMCADAFGRERVIVQRDGNVFIRSIQHRVALSESTDDRESGKQLKEVSAFHRRILTRLLLIAILLVPSQLSAQSTHTVSRITLYSSAALDIATTEKVLRRGGVELNPIAGQNPVRRNAIVIGSTIFTDHATRWLKKRGDSRLAKTLNFLVSGLHVAASIHNARELRKYSDRIN